MDHQNTEDRLVSILLSPGTHRWAPTAKKQPGGGLEAVGFDSEVGRASTQAQGGPESCELSNLTQQLFSTSIKFLANEGRGMFLRPQCRSD